MNDEKITPEMIADFLRPLDEEPDPRDIPLPRGLQRARERAGYATSQEADQSLAFEPDLANSWQDSVLQHTDQLASFVSSAARWMLYPAFYLRVQVSGLLARVASSLARQAKSADHLEPSRVKNRSAEYQQTFNGQNYGHQRGHRSFAIDSLITIGVVCTLVALVVPAVQTAREAARRAQCVANLKQITLATSLYGASHGYYLPSVSYPAPPSWNGWGPSIQLNLLSEVAQPNLWNSYNFDAGQSAANRTVFSTQIGAYLCPSDRLNRIGPQTNYVGNIGQMAAPAFAATGTIIPRVDPTAPKTIIPGLTTRHPYEEMHNQVFIKEMRDGMSSTALFSERLSWRGKIEQVTFGSERDERLRVYFATGLNRISYNNGWDGKSEDFMVLIDACRNLPPDARAAGGLRGDRWYLGHPLLLNYAVYNHSMTPNSPSCSNLNLGLRGLDIYGAAPPSSNHLGGVNLGFADGSVRFIKDSVNWKVWRAIGTRKYGEVVSQDDY